MSLEKILNAESVAIIGASKMKPNAGIRQSGHCWMKNMRAEYIR